MYCDATLCQIKDIKTKITILFIRKTSNKNETKDFKFSLKRVPFDLVSHDSYNLSYLPTLHLFRRRNFQIIFLVLFNRKLSVIREDRDYCKNVRMIKTA